MNLDDLEALPRIHPAVREAAHCDDHIVYQGACWKCLERAALATTGPEETAEYHGHEQEVCEPCWKAGHDVGDTRTADPGGLREAVAAHVACVCAALTGGEGPRPLGNGNWYHFQGCCADSDLALTPEATAPDEEGAKP
jgi:hypothetical protein